ncbi:MAG: YggS family pyridoxal phosphate-dependent enzyme [Frankiaceae bacterium]
MSRREELAANLAALRARLAGACAAAGRDPAGVTLVAVSKTRPATDVRLLAGLGVRDVGENRDQEAAPKAAELADLELSWHFIGQLQTNKCRSVAGYAAVVHSLDRPRLVAALGREAVRADREITALVQVSLDERADPVGRGGVAPGEAGRLADLVASTAGLRLGGVMAVAPADADPDPAFALLAEVAAAVRAVHPGATAVSAGMSGDLESAIRHGATHVRVGTALLGRRAPAVR